MRGFRMRTNHSLVDGVHRMGHSVVADGWVVSFLSGTLNVCTSMGRPVIVLRWPATLEYRLDLARYLINQEGDWAQLFYPESEMLEMAELQQVIDLTVQSN